MKTKWVNAAIVCIGMIGAALCLVRSKEVSTLTNRRAELWREFGYLPIEDPDEACLASMKTDDPMHFRWRIYTPASFNGRIETDGGSSISFSSSNPDEFIAEVRFRLIDDQLMVYQNFNCGSWLNSIGSKELAAFIKDRWPEMEIESSGETGVVVIDDNVACQLLQIRMPPSLVPDARHVLTDRDVEQLERPILTLRFGEAGAFEK